jgi:hypothetical protein
MSDPCRQTVLETYDEELDAARPKGHSVGDPRTVRRPLWRTPHDGHADVAVSELPLVRTVRIHHEDLVVPVPVGVG